MDDATRARLKAQHVEQAEGGFCETCGSLWEWPCAVRELLSVHNALLAERARLMDAKGAPNVILSHWRERAMRAEVRVQDLEAEHAQAAPVLAALESAARALVAGCPIGDPLPLNVSPLIYDLHQAVAALDTNEPVGP